MKYLENIALGTIFVVIAFCLLGIYGNGLIGFTVLMAFTFMAILIALVTNHSDL